ncbi:MAG TPA: thiol:disulfide interchange protein DsbA/DsbL [Gammaproteobacteria bacterium]|nr:thiol:disulfide interchange protein DsbA/DsbL [Gammaproteobacteria bacterium]
MKRNALIVVASLATAAWAGPAAAQSGAVAAAGSSAATNVAKFAAGKDYELLTPAQPTVGDAGGGKVEVAEVFMFGCPHCAAFEPRLKDWLEKAPGYVSFVRIPAVWNAIAELHARAYYTAEALGKTAEIDGPFFAEIHVKHNMLDSEDKLAAFFAQFGVDDKKFRNTFESFAIDAKVSRAQDLVKRYKVPGTPAIVVAGKYLTNGAMAGSYESWFAIVEELAAKEHAPPSPAK